MRTKALSGLCVLADPEMIQPGQLEHAVHRALVGGARIVHYRDQVRDWGQRYHRAAALRDLCTSHDAILIINNDVRLASESGAHGVHLGRDDTSIETAREILGYDHIIGASCYNSLPRARRAVDEGADYVAFSSFYASHTKPGAVHAELGLLSEAKDEFLVPVAASGGIKPDNASKLIDEGADIIIVGEAVFGPHDPEQAALRLARLFEEKPVH